jgi:succinoglycan biosynthesis transport protein ExoP
MTAINPIEPRHATPAEEAPVEFDAVGYDRASEGMLRQWLRILLRWRWMILGAIIVSLLVALAITFMMTRMYLASVSLEISRDEANIVNVQGVEPQVGSLDQEFYQTQYGLLRARSLAESVAQQLNLQDSRAFFALFGEGESLGLYGESPTGPLRPEGRPERLRKATDILLDHINVSPTRASRLVTVNFESPDPELSARVANTWADKFIQKNLERRFEATSYARTFLEGRLVQLRERLETSERALVAYAANNRIIMLTAPSTQQSNQTQERSVVTDNLIAMNDQLATARGLRIAAESRLRSGGAATPESLTNPAINTLRQQRAEAAAEYARLMAQFEPAYPPARALQAQVQQLDASIRREEGRVHSSLENQYREAAAREQDLQTRVADLERETLDQRRRGIQYNIFQRDVDTNRQLYDALLQRYKEIGVAGGVGTNNVAIVDRALAPSKPSRPRPLLNLLIALLAGTAIGIALAFGLEQIDEAVSDPSDIQKSLKIPALGSIPRLGRDESPLDALADRKSSLSEAYLTVVTSLKFSTPEGLPKSLLVTSTRPGEGKSTSSVAIAITLARLGYRTLLIDADMRSPSLHILMDVPNTQGLSDVLSGNATIQSVIRPTTQDNFALLPAGPNPPNAAELLSGVHLDETLHGALEMFDMVVVDAPPIMGLADAPLIASKTIGTLMVVEASGTRSRQAQVALGRLHNSRAAVLGAVLTKFDAKRAQYGYGYDYGYGYGNQDEPAEPAANG